MPLRRKTERGSVPVTSPPVSPISGEFPSSGIPTHTHTPISTVRTREGRSHSLECQATLVKRFFTIPTLETGSSENLDVIKVFSTIRKFTLKRQIEAFKIIFDLGQSYLLTDFIVIERGAVSAKYLVKMLNILDKAIAEGIGFGRLRGFLLTKKYVPELRTNVSAFEHLFHKFNGNNEVLKEILPLFAKILVRTADYSYPVVEYGLEKRSILEIAALIGCDIKTLKGIYNIRGDGFFESMNTFGQKRYLHAILHNLVSLDREIKIKDLIFFPLTPEVLSTVLLNNQPLLSVLISHCDSKCVRYLISVLGEEQFFALRDANGYPMLCYLSLSSIDISTLDTLRKADSNGRNIPGYIFSNEELAGALSEEVRLGEDTLSVAKFFQKVMKLSSARAARNFTVKLEGLLDRLGSDESLLDECELSGTDLWKDSSFQYVNHFFQKSLHKLICWDGSDETEDLLWGYMEVVRECLVDSHAEPGTREFVAFENAVGRMRAEVHKLHFETVMRGYAVRHFEPLKLSEVFHPKEGNSFNLIHEGIVFEDGYLKKNGEGIDFLLLSCFTTSPELFSWIFTRAAELAINREEILARDKDSANRNIFHYLFMSRQDSDYIKEVFNVILGVGDHETLLERGVAIELLGERGQVLGREYSPLEILSFREESSSIFPHIVSILGGEVVIPEARESDEARNIFTVPISELFTFQVPEEEPAIVPLEDICEDLYEELYPTPERAVLELLTVPELDTGMSV